MSESRKSWLYHALSGAFAAIVFCFVMFLTEGVLLYGDIDEMPLWMATLNIGAGMPLAVFLMVTSSIAFVAWSKVPGLRPDGVGAMLQRGWSWLTTGEQEQLGWRSAWILTGCVLLPIWLGVTLVAGDAIQSRIVTPMWAAALIFVGIGLSGTFLALVSSTVSAPIGLVLTRLSALHPRVAALCRPLGVIGVLALIGGVMSLVVWNTYEDIMAVLPWTYVQGSSLGALTALAATWATQRHQRVRVATTVVLSAVTLLLGYQALYLPASMQQARLLFVGQPSVASVTVALVDSQLDFDDDGLSAFYGGGDCGPNDPTIGPQQLDRPDNGIDEDCEGGDFVLGVAEYVAGPIHHPRPASGVVSKPNIILITTDALTWNHTTPGGYHRDVTPNLAKWAERATIFEDAFATAPSTRLALAGLVTGMYNVQVPLEKARKQPFPYEKGVWTMAKMLEQQGYLTVHIPGHKYFGRRNWKKRGYFEGFEVVDENVYRRAASPKHTSPELTDAAIYHIDKAGNRPIFLWIHYYDHHGPYQLPDEDNPQFAGDKAVDRYDNELHHADSQWVRLLEYVEERWTPEEYVMIFTSDHGEAFDKNHPRKHHAYDMHTAVMQVPMIVQTSQRRGERIKGLVSHLDVVPTVASIVGIKPEPDWAWQGESLSPVLYEGKDIVKTILFSVFYLPESRHRDEEPFEQLAVRGNEFYYWLKLEKNEKRLVRWREDPLDNDNLYDELEDEAAKFRYLAAEKLLWFRDNERGLTK